MTNGIFLFILSAFFTSQYLHGVFAEDNGPKYEVTSQTGLARMKTVAKLLSGKFLQEKKVLLPESIIKMSGYSKTEYMLLRLVAFYSGYRFKDDKANFDWIETTKEWPPANLPAVRENKKAAMERTSANAKSHVEFVANLCAIIRDGGIHGDIKFYEYLPIFADMGKIAKYIEEKAKALAEKTGKKYWREFSLAKQHVSEVYGQSEYGLLIMKNGSLDKAEMANKNASLYKAGSYRSAMVRQEAAAKFLTQLEAHNADGDMFEHPEKILHFTKEYFGRADADPAIHEIFDYLAIKVGYARALKEFSEMENANSDVANSVEKLFNEYPDGKEEKNAENDDEEDFVEKAKSPEEMKLKLQGKYVKLLEKMYLVIWEEPFNNKLQNMRAYQIVYDEMMQVEEHYKKKYPETWDKELAEAEHSMKEKLNEEMNKVAAIKKMNPEIKGPLADATAEWSWIYASENFIELALRNEKSHFDYENKKQNWKKWKANV